MGQYGVTLAGGPLVYRLAFDFSRIIVCAVTSAVLAPANRSSGSQEGPPAEVKAGGKQEGRDALAGAATGAPQGPGVPLSHSSPLRHGLQRVCSFPGSG